ncbi:lactosylceramide 1,3-N-acetyl-beta-D-glucosaminyltransferase-like isoform X2 [Dreissena polymorpha]|uniref:Hexosyltransferase n=2 Tax=Dreissena polymorpha TaxID=45954 RepID=A0A9D4MZG3_DREPO|nr:lactosylceramide 1,3-N-acetyl-beta-D-glucosaminyltransferase-like isoform X2 [Dreissena polymorpha]XP_052224305.1 lactosylceramide 1,3-N-acetyl-beta-D-glucosaminyltransferase-like isoform X2 [Dreissena polymorpha]XP_052224312.1 lactosylceramide 1,3-N-acetyl-beta-D-glucosaminyltransferase-like isoform X2 [Dreissena polymorpha]XP_052224317.1 lactosylceramide 1,3-N-acetyl-beta-D-glucosaminyltransferase-like isoform X2 [Dreissena polymorpha]KAH3885366.1 hypothetical protein DPMN_009359 [Dreissen
MKKNRIEVERRSGLAGPEVFRHLIGMCLRSSKKIALTALVFTSVSLVFILNYTRHTQKDNFSWKKIEIKRVINSMDVSTRSLTPNLTRTKVAPSTTTTLSPELKAITPQLELDKLINASSNDKYPVTIHGKYILENSTLCSSAKNLSVLIIVHTAPDHFELRLAIRRTWANDTYYRKLGVSRVLFLLGRVEDAALQGKMEAEFKEYRDMLQGNFLDAYRNLTHKGVMGYRWITERCRNAKFILKTDDDIVVNMFQLFTRVLPNFQNKTKQIFCNHIYAGTMPIIREKKSKWYVNENHFRGKTAFPEYCSGFMVLYTNDVIPAIYRAATMTPFFWVDDVYLYGLAPGHVPGIKYSDMKKTDHMLDGQKALSCYRNVTENLSKKCDYLVTGSRKLQVSVETWVEMRKQFEHVSGTYSPLTTPKISSNHT